MWAFHPFQFVRRGGVVLAERLRHIFSRGGHVSRKRWVLGFDDLGDRLRHVLRRRHFDRSLGSLKKVGDGFWFVARS